MKKQDANFLASSSSSRRENSPENLHSKTIGCMSGFFHLVFNYNNRRHRKFLTSGKKQEKKMEDPVMILSQETENKSRRRLWYDVDRSPMLGAEMRQSKTEKSSAVEKRKKLVEALGKCDEDLKALKKMIDVVKNNTNNNSNKDDDQVLQPSPVSVLQLHSLTLTPPSPSTANYTNGGGGGGGGAILQQQKQKQKKRPGEDEIITNISLVDRLKAVADHVEPINIQAKPFWISRAMIDSVNEVCRDISWGETREIGRIGLALQDFICRDLIEEFVQELACYSCCNIYSLPFDACKRRLLF
ncbi:hypothetical protein Dsin_016768 [Dipteronia sinensis]|uniref:Uncharacterized protein n=1 Tax=Dipteronia sinensis TaxID=43782 RepID=A0AAE0E616_9ROSI|nr:hypothetical protein Dsin_016768 [Dipteronia sinensis]